MVTTAPLLALTITISSLSCKSSWACSSSFEKFEYFGGCTCAISSSISLFVASINVSVAWWFLGGVHVMSVGFLNKFFGLFVWSLKCALSLILW